MEVPGLFSELPTPAFCSFPSEFPSSDVLSPGLGPVTASPRGPACFVRSSPVMRTSTESRKPVSSAHRKTSLLTASQGVNRGSYRVAVTHERYREDPIGWDRLTWLPRPRCKPVHLMFQDARAVRRAFRSRTGSDAKTARRHGRAVAEDRSTVCIGR